MKRKPSAWREFWQSLGLGMALGLLMFFAAMHWPDWLTFGH